MYRISFYNSIVFQEYFVMDLMQINSSIKSLCSAFFYWMSGGNGSNLDSSYGIQEDSIGDSSILSYFLIPIKRARDIF